MDGGTAFVFRLRLNAQLNAEGVSLHSLGAATKSRHPGLTSQYQPTLKALNNNRVRLCNTFSVDGVG
ncbi:MAG: hypothetical protein COA78_08700 [Blastopirellula sp.]|nr:MAG: hypothetical protein COA78_08700 [Blastopirellula sp.]